MDQPRALRELQAALQVRIDALYKPLPAEVRRTFRRHTTDATLTYTTAALILAALENLLRSVDDRTVPVIAQGMAAAAILPTLDEPEIDRAWELAAGAATARHLLTVQETLTLSRMRSVDQVRRVLIGGVQRATPAVEIALHLEQYVNPWYSTRRDADWVQRRAERVGARTSGPAVPGMGSSPARGIMLTETSTAHGQAAISEAQRIPGALVRWRLSPFHREVDPCDVIAHKDNGWGPGIYWPTTVPKYPTHPRCACILDVVIPRREAAA